MSRAGHHWDKLSGARRRRQRAAKAAFAGALAKLGPKDVAVDLGANAGEFTVPMARTGAQVLAFEPDPHAAGLLRAAVQSFENVEIFEVAAGVEAGEATLFRHAAFTRDPDRRSKSSSLFGEKRNVGAEGALSVTVVDFPAFLAELGPVALMKVDIEGAEVPLLEAMFARGLAAQVAQIFVETHERALPELAERTAALKARSGPPDINWDWH